MKIRHIIGLGLSLAVAGCSPTYKTSGEYTCEQRDWGGAITAHQGISKAYIEDNRY